MITVYFCFQCSFVRAYLIRENSISEGAECRFIVLRVRVTTNFHMRKVGRRDVEMGVAIFKEPKKMEWRVEHKR